MTLPCVGVLTHGRPITVQRFSALSFQSSGPWMLDILYGAGRTCSMCAITAGKVNVAVTQSSADTPHASQLLRLRAIHLLLA
jgi:hypothetical protein